MKFILVILSSLFSLFSIAMQPDQKGDFYDQLYVAIKNDDQVGVETLFKESNSTWKIGHWLSKYDPNMQSPINLTSKGHALIHWAARANNLEVLDVLLNDTRTNVDIENANGCTALGFAIAGAKVQATSVLLKYKANPNVIIDKKISNGLHTLLHNGITYYSSFPTRRDDYYKVISLLLCDPQINPNIQDADGKAPLHYAVLLCSEKIVKLLLRNSKTDKNILDNNGKSPIDYAHGLKDKKIKTVLLKDQKK